MKILFVNCAVSEKYFSDIFASLRVKPEVSIQNYFNLLYKGLDNSDCELFALSERQISTSENGIYLKGKADKDDYAKYYYVPKFLIPGISQLFSLITNFFISLYIIFKFKPDVIICDVMRFYISTPALLASKILRKKSVAFLADLPQMYNHQSMEKKKILSLLKWIYSCPLKFYDAFILLSNYMNQIVNPENKDNIIIEGLVDSDITPLPHKVDTNNARTIFMYAGGLHAKYGVRLLIDAVINSKQNVELWLFGKGDQESYLQGLSSDRVKFFGYKPRNFVLKKEKEADFLINPRFTNEEYTMYSFPSKIMEYMISRVPVVTTRIKGIPNDYFKFLITIDREDIKGFENVFEKCNKMTLDERKNIADSACKFVLDNKNFNIQGSRLFQWLNQLLAK